MTRPNFILVLQPTNGKPNIITIKSLWHVYQYTYHFSIYTPLFPAPSPFLFRSSASLNNTDLSGHTAFFPLLVCCLDRIDSGFPKSYDNGIDREVYCESLIYVVYHRKDYLIPVYGRGNHFSLSSQDSSDQTGIKFSSIKCTTQLINLTCFFNI